MKKILYDVLQFFAQWLSQPTIIQVAGSIDVRPTQPGA